MNDTFHWSLYWPYTVQILWYNVHHVHIIWTQCTTLWHCSSVHCCALNPGLLYSQCSIGQCSAWCCALHYVVPLRSSYLSIEGRICHTNLRRPSSPCVVRDEVVHRFTTFLFFAAQYVVYDRYDLLGFIKWTIFMGWLVLEKWATNLIFFFADNISR